MSGSVRGVHLLAVTALGGDRQERRPDPRGRGRPHAGDGQLGGGWLPHSLGLSFASKDSRLPLFPGPQAFLDRAMGDSDDEYDRRRRDKFRRERSDYDRSRERDERRRGDDWNDR